MKRQTGILTVLFRNCHIGRCDRGGFTLVEVVVALILIGVVVAVTFEALSVSRRLSIKADETLEAARILQNLLNDRLLIHEVLLKGEDVAEVSGILPDELDWGYWVRMTPLLLLAEDEQDPVDVPSVMRMDICAVHLLPYREKRFCVDRWFRNDEVLLQVGGLQQGQGASKSKMGYSKKRKTD